MVDTVVTTAGSLEYSQEAGAKYSLMDRQCRCRLKTVIAFIVQLLWVRAQLPTLHNAVEYPESFCTPNYNCLQLTVN